MSREKENPEEPAAEREEDRLEAPLDRSDLEKIVGGEKTRPGVGPTSATVPVTLD